MTSLPEKIPSNAHFLSEAKNVSGEDYVFYDPRKAPFSLHGLMVQEDGAFRRMPWEVAFEVSPKVYTFHTHTSGGRIRFVTDADRFAIRVKYPSLEIRPQLSLQQSVGFDVYLEEEGRERFYGVFSPPIDAETGYCLEGKLPGGPVTVVLYFPLYNDVTDCRIGLPEGAAMLPAAPYSELPLLFYGSSITQGASASRSGLSYPARIARKLGMDFHNLGFASGCKGEKRMADYLATVPSSALILDYDHNAPSAEHLEKTHFYCYESYRAAHPSTPIIMVSRPTCTPDKHAVRERRRVIMDSYRRALEQGDKNVYFTDGSAFFLTEDRFDCVMDGIHPNDQGMARMAEVIGETVARALGKK